MSLAKIICKIRSFINDPLAQIFFCEYSTEHGDVIRFNGGWVQHQRKGDDFFSLGVDVDEWLETVSPTSIIEIAEGDLRA
jgi:hypothetical protein